MRKFSQNSFLSLLLMFLLLGCQDQTEKKIDKLFSQWNSNESPGAAVAVVKNGKTIFKKGYGLANLEYGIPVTPPTI